MAGKCTKKINVALEGVLDFENGLMLLEVEDLGVVEVAEKVAFMSGEKVKVTFTVSEEIL